MSLIPTDKISSTTGGSPSAPKKEESRLSSGGLAPRTVSSAPARASLAQYVSFSWFSPQVAPTPAPASAKPKNPKHNPIEVELSKAAQRAHAAGEQCEQQAWYDGFVSKYTAAPRGFAKDTREGSAGNIKYNVATHPGNCPYMQDRVCITKIKCSDVEIPVFGIFDGHGDEPHGGKVPDWLKNNLPKFLEKHLSTCENLNDSEEVHKAILKAFDEANAALKKAVEGSGIAGSTATLAFQIGEEMWFANVGDSRAIAVGGGRYQTLTHDARPTDPYFKEYLKKCGGEIVKNGDQYVVKGPIKYLASVTTFGDFLVTHGCTPTITRIPVPKDGSHVILGCDGIWDVFSSKTIAKTIGRTTPKAEDLLYMAYNGRRQLTLKYTSKEPGMGQIDNLSGIVLSFAKEEAAPSAKKAPTLSSRPPSSEPQ